MLLINTLNSFLLHPRAKKPDVKEKENRYYFFLQRATEMREAIAIFTMKRLVSVVWKRTNRRDHHKKRTKMERSWLRMPVWLRFGLPSACDLCVLGSRSALGFKIQFNGGHLNSTQSVLRCERTERVNVPRAWGITITERESTEQYVRFMRVSFVYCITLRSVMIWLILFIIIIIILLHLFHFRLLLLPSIRTKWVPAHEPSVASTSDSTFYANKYNVFKLNRNENVCKLRAALQHQQHHAECVVSCCDFSQRGALSYYLRELWTRWATFDWLSIDNWDFERFRVIERTCGTALIVIAMIGNDRKRPKMKVKHEKIWSD